jgi:AcrR family transcriptional regulator
METSTTRDRILQAAHERFTHQGFANTAVREICEDAGVTAPVLYYHFGNKDGVFQAVVEATLNLGGFCDLLRKEVAAHPDPWDKLHTFVKIYLTAFPVETLNPGLHLGSSTQLNDTSLHRFAVGLQATFGLLREILQSGIDAGTFREVDVDTAAACLLGTADSFVRSRAYLGLEYDGADLADRIVDLFAGGLQAG